MTLTENEMLLHQVYFEKYKNGVTKRTLEVLANVNARISDMIKESKIVATKEKYRELARRLREYTLQAKAEYMGSFDIEGVMDEEIQSQLAILERCLDREIVFSVPSVGQVRTASMFKPMVALNSRTFESTFNYWQANLYQVWDSAIRTGYLTGQTTRDIVKAVMGSVTGIENDMKPNRMSQIRKSVELNTRTILQSFADDSRRAVFELNEDVIEGYRILATLDRRTCLICGSLSEKKYKSISDVPSLPVHYGCRCVVVPITVFDRIYTGKRSAEMEEVEGDWNYKKWLDSQDEETQKDILGGRYEFYSRKKSLESQFITDNSIISMKTLREKNENKY